MSLTMRVRPNKYSNLKPSDQHNTSGQRRMRRWIADGGVDEASLLADFLSVMRPRRVMLKNGVFVDLDTRAGLVSATST